MSFISDGANSPLLRRIGNIRKQLATELGFIIPAVRVTDNLSLRAREYSISLKGVEIARFELPQGCDMAIAVTATDKPPDGRPTKDPAFGVAAWWIPSCAGREGAVDGLYRDRPAQRDEHASGGTDQAVRHELFSRQEAKKVLDRVSAENAKVVEDLVPKLLPLATVQRVFQNLLRERVSIRDAVSILEGSGRGRAFDAQPGAADGLRAAGDPAGR